MNSKDETTLQKFTKELSILHYAITFGAFMMTAVVYFIAMKDHHFSITYDGDFFLWLCPLIAIGGVFAGAKIYKNNLSKIKVTNDLDAKLAKLRSASIMKFAFIEGPALICIVAAMTTGNFLYIMLALILILYLFSQRIQDHKIREVIGAN